MSYSLNSLKGGFIRDHIRTLIGVIKVDVKSLDCIACRSYTPEP